MVMEEARHRMKKNEVESSVAGESLIEGDFREAEGGGGEPNNSVHGIVVVSLESTNDWTVLRRALICAEKALNGTMF
jgi:hypothetical protein